MNFLQKLFPKKKYQQGDVTPGGSTVYSYKKPSKDTVPSYGEEKDVQALEAHIEKHVGKIEMVFHEMISAYTHVDVYWIAPTPKRNFHTLITGGLSFKPMHAPKGAEKFHYGELMMCLPPDWEINTKNFEDENNYWPVRWLKILARFPHQFDTWLSRGHTIPLSESGEPHASKNPFEGVYVTFPILFGLEFMKVEVSPKKTIWIYSLIPIYKKEWQYKLDKGADALEALMDEHQITELLDPKRRTMV
jgi:hypothetical protein